MTPSQLVLEQALLMRGKNGLWLNTLIFPAYIAGISALLVLLHILLSLKPTRKLYSLLVPPKLSIPEFETMLNGQLDVPSVNVLAAIRQHVEKHGGWTTFFHELVQCVGCLALLGLSAMSLVIQVDEAGLSSGRRFSILNKWDKDHDSMHTTVILSTDDWLQAAMCVTYLYASFLAFISAAASPRWSRLMSRHLALILLVSFAVFAYRDIFPLATFTIVPKDLAEGWILWAKIIVLTLIAVISPLLVPRQYIPADPKEPMVEPNPEQTTSLLSLVTYAFLDPVIFLAYRIPHLAYSQLPPLADYDQSKYLIRKSFPHLDPFSGAKKRHIFFGLMRVFRVDYSILAVSLVLQVLAAFASPLGINRLLHYLETNGEGAVFRPWFWISWLLLGPIISSICWQWYIFIATRTLVRVQGIITQLVFEHSLRVRMKAETSESSNAAAGDASAVQSPDNASVESAPLGPGSTEAGGDDTFNSSSGHEFIDGAVDATHSSSSSASMSPATTKGKQYVKVGDGSVAKQEEHSTYNNLVGKINNLVTTDLENIVDARDFLWILIQIPLQIILSIIFLYAVLGWSALVGLVVMLLLFPLPGFVAHHIQWVQVERMKKTDARVQTVGETMNVLRMIKLFGWEAKMNEKVQEKREVELSWIWKRKLLDLINNNLNFLIPIATMLATYTTYTLVMKQDLNASKVFSSMAVFDILRNQLHLIFYSVTQSVEGKVSLDRVNDFLHNTELLDSFSEGQPEVTFDFLQDEQDTRAIGFRNAVFSWSNNGKDGALTPSKRKFLLYIEDELKFKRGCINLIIGPTGSGKTSMLMALLGEMHFMPNGPNSWYNLPRSGGVAYAAQESWVQNESIRENIIFGAEFDENRYKKVIYQCGLERDLTLFEAGDKTEVGEKGLTLSGGQKARITLARAIYSSAELVLLDDVLAALDVHTSKWVVEKCLKGDLIHGRTVILVTHNVALASPIANFVVSLGKDGRVLSQSSDISTTVLKDKQLAYEAKRHKQVINKAEGALDTPPAEETSDGKLVIAEEIAEGHISWPALKLLLAGLGGNHPFLFFLSFVGGILTVELSNTAQVWYLGYWASQYEDNTPKVNVIFYLTVYCSLLLFGIIVYTAVNVVFVFGALRASRKVHKQLIGSVLGTTLRWLDTTPTARVIARCTQDIRALDGPVSQTLGFLNELTISMLIKFSAVVLFTPIFLFPGICVAALGGYCGQIYMKAQLSVKREMSNARSPVLGHFGAAIAGLTSIRAYGAQQAFRVESLNRIDRFTRAARTFYNLNRWVCIRIDVLGAAFAAALATYLVYGRSVVTSSNTGFSLNMAIAFSSMILWWVRLLNEFEVQGNSLERIQGYVTIEQEPKSTEGGKPPTAWPASGELRVENLSARYSSDGPNVLHDLSFHIKSGERVGIVGRTGSGKSSLTLSLLRCIKTEGTVYYDGIPTNSLNLDDLRSNITIIPQIPELISGTLRTNLDPFSQYDDLTLNDALRAAGLFSLEAEDKEGRISLDSAISSGGNNLSVGQRQILALARAIVRGSKLLILDEATSAIDYKTDSVIQSSLRHELGGDVTLITVAHRLQTIMDADKIMVLDAGRIVEFDNPSALLEKEDGVFRALVDESGDKEILESMAKAGDALITI